MKPDRRRDRRRAAALAAGVATVAVAVSPPLERLAAERFAAHMVQHLLLILVAAPLLAAARPARVALGALPRGARRALHRSLPGAVRRLLRLVRHPVAVWLAATAVLWAWHSPALYQLALRSDAFHAVEHLMLLASAGLFWSLVLEAGRGGARTPRTRPVAVALVFATTLAGGALGVALTFAGAPLYPEQAAAVAAAGGDPLADQQLAGALMWLPPGFVYLAVMAVLVVRWFADIDRRTPAVPGPPAAEPTGPAPPAALREVVR